MTVLVSIGPGVAIEIGRLDSGVDGAAPSSFFLVLAPETRGLEDLADSAGVEDLKGVLLLVLLFRLRAERRDGVVKFPRACWLAELIFLPIKHYHAATE